MNIRIQGVIYGILFTLYLSILPFLAHYFVMIFIASTLLAIFILILLKVVWGLPLGSLLPINGDSDDYVGDSEPYDPYREAHDFAREKASYGGWVRDINGESYQFVKNGNASPNYVIDSKGEWHNVTYDEDGVHIMGHYHDDKLK